MCFLKPFFIDYLVFHFRITHFSSTIIQYIFYSFFWIGIKRVNTKLSWERKQLLQLQHINNIDQSSNVSRDTVLFCCFLMSICDGLGKFSYFFDKWIVKLRIEEIPFADTSTLAFPKAGPRRFLGTQTNLFTAGNPTPAFASYTLDTLVPMRTPLS